MKIINFAYGSNMLIQKLHVNVPSASKICIAHLPGHQFKFNKLSVDRSVKGNIVKSENSDDNVWGVLYEIDVNEKRALDREEGLGRGYNEQLISVYKEDQTQVEALVYVADESAIREDLLPYDWYWEMVIIGASANRFDEKYLFFLRSFSYIVDPDEERREAKYKILLSI